MVQTLMEYYSAFKGKGSLTHTNMWTNPEDVMQREINQSQRGKYCMIPLMWDPKSSQIYRDGMWNGGCQGQGEREKGKLLFSGCRISVWDDDKLWR